MAVAPTMHLNPNPSSGINSYKLPASLSNLLEHLTTSSPPQQPRASIAECDKKMEEAVEQERGSEAESDTQNQETKNDGGKAIYLIGFSQISHLLYMRFGFYSSGRLFPCVVLFT
jgi:hypothetical protein